ncbi:hypothetical protein [Actinomadura oligospora]|uniref:hypothetical protein n=1 Tax=Actinomadura oligospora TaxID=111804 RepID=UPI0004791DD7|nr:hypothetical protein [Actinomadura oligospora]
MTSPTYLRDLAPDDSGVFWVSEVDDRERASDGKSRYGAYLRQNLHLFDPWDEKSVGSDPVEFVTVAWQVATSPVMAPPYLHCRWDRLLSAKIWRADTGAAVANLELVSSAPSELERSGLARSWNSWSHSRSLGAYLEPSEQVMAQRPTLLPRVNLLCPVLADQLHRPSPAWPGCLPGSWTRDC